MIDFIEGKVVAIKDSTISLLLPFNIALSLIVFEPTKYKINSAIKIFAYLFKSEESNFLYGFDNEVDRFLFSELIKINGIGPKTSYNILKKVTGNTLISLVKNKDIETLRKISFIGNKADRVYYELKNKVINLDIENIKYKDVADALINFGYSMNNIFLVLNSLPDGLNSGEALKEAIVLLKNE